MKLYFIIILTILLLSACSQGTNQEETQPQLQEEQTQEQESLPEQETQPKQPPPIKEELEITEQPDCSSFKFDNSPLEDIEMIQPLGLLTGSHVTPIDHQYWTYKTNPDVRAPAKGTITHIGKFKELASEEQFKVEDDFRMVIRHDCNIETIYIHMNGIPEEILSKADFRSDPTYESAAPNIKVEANQLLGKVKRQAVDFSVHDYNIELDFITPKFYEREPFKIHTVDPFDYFEEPLRSELMEKSLRTKSPIGGKIAFDQKGRLIGTWFKENTKGYEGTNQERYWDGHLSIVYDYIDPTQIRISIGDYNGRSEQFGVIGNKPKPETVSKNSGMIEYELTNWEYYSNGEHWDRQKYADNIVAENAEEVMGTITFKVLENEKLEVTVNDEQKRIYER